jgi:two-component system, cell cycle sensor histidine kinase and response regulator CckA
VHDRPTLEGTVALLEATLEATHDGILVISADRRLIHFNRRFVEMFRVPADVLARRNVVEMRAFIANQLVVADGERLLSDRLWDNDSAEYLAQMRFKDGRVFDRFVAPQRIGGDVVGRVISYRDVTQTIQHAAALERHRAFLEKAQEVAHIGSWVAELDGTDHLGWSRETHRIFGVEPDEFVGTSDAFFAFVHPDDCAAVHAASEAAQRQGSRYEIDHRIVRTDGSVRWVREEADVLRDSTGRAIRLIGTVQDITDRRLLEDQLRQSQKMEAIGRLAGGIAHDLNNALTAIAGYSELALSAVPGDHPARADVQEIRRAAERAASVTRQLLAFSRKQLLEPRLFDLNETVGSIARLLSRIVGHDIRIHTRLSRDIRPILGDPGQVEQAIVNLAVNARDAMPSGGDLTLTTSRETIDETFARTHVPMPAGEYIVLCVTDTGQGMSSETKARIFEPFFTTKAPGKGTGLGLSMVYGTLKQIGGFIFVDTESGRGTTFNLYFPPAPDAVLLPSLERGAVLPEARRYTLLVAEDEDAVRHLVASALREERYTLLLTSSAEEALHIADTHEGPIDLLLTDAIMPGKSGVTLAQTLVDRWPSLRVIFMSGYTDEDLSIAGIQTPAPILQKPFTPRDLRRRIRDALDR